jgi:hypothetical protein
VRSPFRSPVFLKGFAKPLLKKGEQRKGSVQGTGEGVKNGDLLWWPLEGVIGRGVPAPPISAVR